MRDDLHIGYEQQDKIPNIKCVICYPMKYEKTSFSSKMKDVEYILCSFLLGKKRLHQKKEMVEKKKKLVYCCWICFDGLPKRMSRIAYSFSVRHSRRGINTFGSLIPAVTSKNDVSVRPNRWLWLMNRTGIQASYVHVPKVRTVSFDGVVWFPPLINRIELYREIIARCKTYQIVTNKPKPGAADEPM